MWLQVQYGFLSAERRHEMRSVANAVSTDGRMCKIYSVLHLLGFGKLMGLDVRDQATLTLVEKYVKFKQGEIWHGIAARFHLKGFEPTGSDRARLQSGVDFSEQLATIVAQDQRRLLQARRLSAHLVHCSLVDTTVAWGFGSAMVSTPC